VPIYFTFQTDTEFRIGRGGAYGAPQLNGTIVEECVRERRDGPECCADFIGS
jgi:hypothetical protein